MSVVQAKNMVLSIRLDDENNTSQPYALICATECSLNVQSSTLPTKHKSTGIAQSFIYKDYAWSVTAQGIYKITTSDTTLWSGDALLTSITKQRKYVIQFASTDGTDTITYYGRVLVTSLQLVSSQGDIGRVNIELQGDGELYYSEKASYLPDTFASASYGQYIPSGTVSNFTDSNLTGKHLIMVAKNKKILTIETDNSAPNHSPASGGVSFLTTNGNLQFNPDITTSDIIEYFYD